MAPQREAIKDEDIFFLPDHEVDLRTISIPEGTILDVGGGGDGIIGHMFGDRTVSIDLSRDELLEAGGVPNPMVMDGTRMGFREGSFDLATFFFSLMFMPSEAQKGALCEAARVLKPRGEIWIWDMAFERKASDRRIFAVPLKVLLPGGRAVDTGYGCLARDQAPQDILRLAEDAGLHLEEMRSDGGTFFIRLKK